MNLVLKYEMLRQNDTLIMDIVQPNGRLNICCRYSIFQAVIVTSKNRMVKITRRPDSHTT